MRVAIGDRAAVVPTSAVVAASAAAGAAVAIGPGLGTRPLLGLDLVLVSPLPVPPGVWGLGPALPQRMPLGLVLAGLSHLIGGPLAGELVIIVAIAAAAVGVARLLPSAPALARLGAGLLYGLSPFALTRAGVGHLHVLVAMAVLPWALTPLLHASDNLRRTFLWAALLSVGGATGGLFVAALVLGSLIADRGRNAVRCVLVVVVSQIPWLAPGVVAVQSSASISGAGAFPTAIGSPLGLLRLAAGGGFWRPSEQVGGGLSQAVLGAGVLLLAALGTRQLPSTWGRRLLGVAIGAAVVATASAVPGIRGPFEWLTAHVLIGALRESQRVDALFLVWLAPAAALGAVRVASMLQTSRPRLGSLALAVPTSLALLAAAPGLLGGAQGNLRPVTFPADWVQMRHAVTANPGTVLAFPWHQYLDVDFAGGRRVLNPVPDYLGMDVLSSFDPENGPAHQEQTDHRAAGINELVLELEKGHSISRDLAAKGVRWVVLLHEVDWEAYRALAADTGLRRTLAGPTLDLYEVRNWHGTIVTASGAVVRGSSPIAPFQRLDTSDAVVWNRAGEPGWLRGFSSGVLTSAGILSWGDGSTFLWYWPALFVVGAELAWLVALLVLLRRSRVRGE